MRALVLAKAPVPGQVKTRLGAVVGMEEAAELAAAALLDTLEACAGAFGPARCHLALSGALDGAARGDELARALTSWHVFGQRGDGLGERIAQAHLDLDRLGPLVQVGMDTPQVTSDDLLAASGRLADADAVMGPAEDGGWWLLGLRRPVAAVALIGVPMSSPNTYAGTRRALEGVGLDVLEAATVRDVDTTADAEVVAGAAPHTRFARAWAATTAGASPP